MSPSCPLVRKPGTQKTRDTNKRHQYAGHDSTSPSTGASWTSTSLLGMVPVKVMQEAAIQDVAPMNPPPFRRTKSLPIDQELETMSLPTDIQNVLDRVGGLPLITWGGLSWRDQIRLRECLNLRDMESGMRMNPK